MPSARSLFIVAAVVVGGFIALAVFGGSAGGACGLSTAAVIAIQEELSHGRSGHSLEAEGVATAVCIELAEKELHNNGLPEPPNGLPGTP